MADGESARRPPTIGELRRRRSEMGSRGLSWPASTTMIGCPIRRVAVSPWTRVTPREEFEACLPGIRLTGGRRDGSL